VVALRLLLLSLGSSWRSGVELRPASSSSFPSSPVLPSSFSFLPLLLSLSFVLQERRRRKKRALGSRVCGG
jgi:hypothetical protein